MSTRSKGRKNEKRTQAALELDGWRVELVKGSTMYNKSVDFFGLFDIIAVRNYEIQWVQVKTNRNASPSDRKAMMEFPAPGLKSVWIWKDRVKTPVIHRL